MRQAAFPLPGSCIRSDFTAAVIRRGYFLALLVLLYVAGTALASAEKTNPKTLFDYPDTALEGTLAERLTSSFEECRRNCSANASCAGFDYSPRSFDCRLFSKIDAARRHPYSTAGTRLPVDGYMAPVTQITPTGKPSEGPAPETECDRLAAHPEDSGKIASVRGRHWIPREATAQCEEAVAAYPNEPRFWFQLGRAYWERAPYEDRESAEALFRKAADAGYAAGYVALGHILEFFKSGSRQEWIDLYQQAVDKGDNWGMAELAEVYTHRSPSNEQDRSENASAHSLLQRCAELGSALCQYRLGWMYSLGTHVQRSDMRAIDLFRQSAENGFIMAMLHLGDLYSEGKHIPDSGGIEENHQLAAKYFVQALRTEAVSGWFVNHTPPIPAGVIREIQAELNAEGVYDGQIDGKLGPATHRAIEAFNGAAMKGTEQE